MIKKKRQLKKEISDQRENAESLKDGGVRYHGDLQDWSTFTQLFIDFG